MYSSENVIVTNGGYSRNITSSGVNSKNLTCTETYFNNGAAIIYSDQANTSIFRNDCHTGCIGDDIRQINGNQCLTIGGKNENRFEGSHYKIVGSLETYSFHPVSELDKLNSDTIAYRSGFGDDRNDPTAALKPPSIGMDVGKIASSVTNQTNNNVKLPDPPAKTGNFLKDHEAAVAYDAMCAGILAKENLKHQLYQQTIGKFELMYERAKMIYDHIDDMKCDPAVKEQIKKAKGGSITAMASLPGTAIEVLMAKVANDLKKKDTFDRDAYYQTISKDDEKRNKLEAMT